MGLNLDRSRAVTGPLQDRVENWRQASRFRRHFILDAWRHLRINGAIYQPVPFQLSQCDSQHVLGDTGNRPAKFAESIQPLTEQKQNLQLPLAGQKTQRVSDLNPQRVTISGLRSRLSMLSHTGMIYHIRYQNPFWLTAAYYIGIIVILEGRGRDHKFKENRWRSAAISVIIYRSRGGRRFSAEIADI